MKTKVNPSYLQSLSKENENKGFTLTELLIVIVITGIIPAIVMPLFLNHYNFDQAQITLEN